MYKTGYLLLFFGVIIFFTGGLGLAFGFIDGEGPALPVISVFALVLIGLGGYLKNKSRKDD